ncbi:MAG: ketopantoate reductase C-terminal domain-containing protein, partial [Spirochaetales bacterium]|nr:ketopantoate reductase C-terminal domain-containing protein [Spirochaetales bacterium]
AESEAGKAFLPQLETDFTSSKIPVTIASDLGEARWRKLLWNIPYNGLSVVLESDTKELMESDSSRQILKKLMIEVVEAANACGYSIKDEEVDNMLKYTDGMTPYEPSMKLDHNFKRPMEIEYMYRKPISAAEKNGYKMEYTTMLCRQLEFINSKNIPKK